MRIREVRISGFRSIPFCADIETPDGAGVRTAKAVRIQWRRDAFRFQLPTRRSGGRSMLSAIIGANSAGKSTILLALDMAFGNTAKLDEAMFNGKQTDEPVIVEVTVQGEIERPSQWHAENCTLNGKTYALTVAAVWTAAGRAPSSVAATASMPNRRRVTANSSPYCCPNSVLSGRIAVSTTRQTLRRRT